MREIARAEGWAQGRFRLVASSSAAEAEWGALVIRAPEAAQAAFERLSSEPLTRQQGRQFPLRGRPNKPFWEFEVSAADRIYYAVDIQKLVVIVAVRADAHTGEQVTKVIERRRAGFQNTIQELKREQEILAKKKKPEDTNRKN